MTLLDHIKQIIELSEIEGMTDAFFTEAKKNISHVCRKAKLNRIEAVFFSHFLDNADKAVSLYEIGKNLKMDNLEAMKYHEAIESLEKKNYILRVEHRRYGQDNQLLYSVPVSTQKKVSSGKFPCVKTTGLNTEEFFNCVQPVFDRCSDNELDFSGYEREIYELLNNNKNLPLIQKLDALDLSPEEKLLFITLCYIYLDKSENRFYARDIEDIYKNGTLGNWRKLRSSLDNLNHSFFASNILEPAIKSGFGDRCCFCFTRDILSIIDRELDIKIENRDNRKGLLRVDDIVEKTMLYNEKESKKLEDLFSLLLEDNFKQIQNRLSENGMRSGFACLFSGSAGTGKTETVYQLARKTGRDVMYVDISETKSKWFSESEKITKGIFTRYKQYVEENSIAPILLFNEADAVFSKRRQLDDTRGGPGQTENAVQNIILQEMEDLKGILICTTNLTKNFDKAFERRFLYKIEFEKPSAGIRKKIWQHMISGLSDEEVNELSSFELTGGQIENVARKHSIGMVLKGEAPSLDAMKELCRDEALEKENSKCIGFGN